MKVKIPNDKTAIYLPVHIPNETCLEMTLKCLNTLREHTKDYFLIVAHDDKNDLGQELLKERADYYFRIHNPEVSAQTNTGFLIQTCSEIPYMVFIENDVFFTPGWLEAVREQMAKPEVGVTSVMAEIGETLSHQFKEESLKNRICGAVVAFKTACVLKVGWFESQRFAAESDYYVRVIKSGYEINEIQKTFVWHKSGFTTIREVDPEYDKKLLSERDYFQEKWKGQDTYGLI